MARITPSTGSFSSPPLEDHDPYPARLTAIEWVTSSEQYGGEKRLQLDWDLGNDIEVRDWVSLKLGKQQSGQVSKLRALINAISGKPEGTEVAWFDDETLEFSYDGTVPHYKLEIGTEITLRGTSVLKEDGTRRFSVKVYQPAKVVKAKQATAPKVPVLAGARSEAQVAADEVDPDEVPF